MSNKVNDPDRPVTEQGIATDYWSPRDPTATLFFSRKGMQFIRNQMSGSSSHLRSAFGSASRFRDTLGPYGQAGRTFQNVANPFNTPVRLVRYAVGWKNWPSGRLGTSAMH